MNIRIKSLNNSRRLFLSVFWLCLLMTVSGRAATYVVTTTADSGTGSLRDAVTTANGTIDDDIINFTIAGCPAATCSIVLTGGEIAVNATATAGKLTIAHTSGSSIKIIISGNNTSRVFFEQTGADLTLDSLTITGGNGNGTTNAIYNGSGGGIANIGGLLTLTNSTVSNNSVTISGGGLYINGGTVNINNSTISSNTANGGTAGSGGGIFMRVATLTLTSSTIANNSSFTNGGGIYILSNAASNAAIRNTLIAANTSGAQADIFKGAASVFTSNGNNLIGDTSNGSAITYRSTDIRSVLPLIAPLGFYSGNTPTHALLANSPAINAGSPTGAPPSDQRGFTRNGNADIGAFELQPQDVYNFGTRFDFDGDGRSDVSVFRSNNWYIQLSGNSNFYGVPFGVATDKLAPADYDGDGKTDIAVWRENVSGNQSYFYILNSSNNSVRIENFGLTGDVLTVGDWDGDGKADPSVYREGAQSFLYYRSSFNNSAGNITYLPWGTSGDKEVRGDFDGDGKLDAAIYRGSNQTWYIRNSRNGAVTYTTFGLPSDKRVSGDFDGDGKTDICVFRSGVWYVLQSSNNQIRYINWGTDTDSIVAADYDGDGKTDAAVWRNGVYYILNSSNSSVGYQYFGMTGDVPIASAFVQ